MITVRNSPVYVNRVRQDWMANGGVYGDGGISALVPSNDPFAQLGPTLDLTFAGNPTDLLTASTTAGYTLDTYFTPETYQIAVPYAIWGDSGLVQKNFADIVTFTRASTATYFNSAGTLTSAAVDEARFDYNPSTLAAQGLLIEEARTNLCLQSADFTTTWSQTNVTITANTTASPDGGTNGDTLLINANGATTAQTSQSFTAGSTLTVSVFAKKNASNFVRFEVGGLVNCWFDLNTGVTGTNSAGSGNVLFSAKSIQAISNGWYRCVLTVTTTTITTLGVNIFATNTDNSSSSINSSIFLWGAQFEAGAFPTSYIPTTTATVTRSEDRASVNTLSPWYNATEGTLYAEGVPISPSSSFTRVAAIEDSAFNSVISIQRNGTDARGFGDGASTIVASAMPQNTVFKAALAAKINDFALSANGSAVNPDTTTNALPTANRLGLGATTAFTSYTNLWLRRVTYYPRRLSNADLQTITT